MVEGKYKRSFLIKIHKNYKITYSFCVRQNKNNFRRSERMNLSIFRKNIKVSAYLFVKVSTEHIVVFF